MRSFSLLHLYIQFNKSFYNVNRKMQRLKWNFHWKSMQIILFDDSKANRFTFFFGWRVHIITPETKYIIRYYKTMERWRPAQKKLFTLPIIENTKLNQIENKLHATCLRLWYSPKMQLYLIVTHLFSKLLVLFSTITFQTI